MPQQAFAFRGRAKTAVVRDPAPQLQKTAPDSRECRMAYMNCIIDHHANWNGAAPHLWRSRAVHVAPAVSTGRNHFNAAIKWLRVLQASLTGLCHGR